MAHIDASLMRVVVDNSFVTKELLDNPASSLYYNLHGVYDADAFNQSASSLPDAFCAAIIIAHEQRHYVDYLLTNYGSWLARFWPQFKQTVPSLISYEGMTPIPLRYWTDECWAEQLGVALPDDVLVRKAAIAATNRGTILDKDRVPELKSFAWLTGTAQLEALATVFEVGPIETNLMPSSWLQIAERLPRNLDVWRKDYIWPAEVFQSIGFGNNPRRVEDFGDVADTRLWPTVLVASLMGRFSELNYARVSKDPSVWSDVLPSRRFMRLVNWLGERHRDKLRTSEEAWDAVNEGCTSLFGHNVTESLNDEVATIEEMVRSQLPTNNTPLSYATFEILAHVQTRRKVADLFTSEPMKFLDPDEYWNVDTSNDVRMTPDYFFVNKRGFIDIPHGHEPFTSWPYSARSEGRPIFVKPIVESEFGTNMQHEDEILTCLGRYYLDGCRSSSWIGPELAIVKQALHENQRLIIIPPYGTHKGLY